MTQASVSVGHNGAAAPAPRGSVDGAPRQGRSQPYAPPPGLSVPVVTIFDRAGRIIEDEQRAVIRYVIQQGSGARVIFAAGTTGEWHRIDNPRRQQAARLAVEECRSVPGVEAWVGVTAPTAAETVENLAYALELKADAAVIAPLSVADAADPVTLVERDFAAVFAKHGASLPVFLYDNAEIAAPGKAQHLHTRDVKRMSRLPYVWGIKVTASKAVLGNYTKAAAHFKSHGQFAIYPGNPYLIFDLFAAPAGLLGWARRCWNRYLMREAEPYGVVAGAGNVWPREWNRAWEVCRQGDLALMRSYAEVLGKYRQVCTMRRGNQSVLPAIACLKAALVELGVCGSDAVAPGTPALSAEERGEFARRFKELRSAAGATLESAWLSRVEALPQPPAYAHN